MVVELRVGGVAYRVADYSENGPEIVKLLEVSMSKLSVMRVKLSPRTWFWGR